MDFKVSQLLIMGKEKLGEDKTENNQEGKKVQSCLNVTSHTFAPVWERCFLVPPAFGQFSGNQKVRKWYFRMKLL